MSITYIPRVTQLDSIHLDDQLEELFKHLLFQTTKYFEFYKHTTKIFSALNDSTIFHCTSRNSNLNLVVKNLLHDADAGWTVLRNGFFVQPGLLQPVLPELELLLRTWIFKYSLYDKKCTFGQQMLSMRYKTENFTTSKLYWYYVYTVLLRYIKDRALYSYTSNIKVQNVLNRVEKVQLVGDILNFLGFIQSGKYPTLIDFILGLHLSADRITRENLSDFSWTRELLWHNLIELTGTVLSLFNMFGLRQKVTKLLRHMWWKSYTRSSVMSGSPVMTIHTVCPCCSKRPILPHVMGCSHVFCYYCLTANKMADADFVCPKCYFNGKDVCPYAISSIVS